MCIIYGVYFFTGGLFGTDSIFGPPETLPYSRYDNDDEAAVAGQAVKLYQSGKTMRAIARHLNERGVPTKLGKQWRNKKASRLIKRAT